MHHIEKLSSHDEVADNVVPTWDISPGRTVSYPQVIGSLMYAMLGSCPDLAYSFGVLGCFAANPKAIHWCAAKRVLLYLSGTKSLRLCYNGGDVNIDMNFLVIATPTGLAIRTRHDRHPDTSLLQIAALLAGAANANQWWHC